MRKTGFLVLSAWIYLVIAPGALSAGNDEFVIDFPKVRYSTADFPGHSAVVLLEDQVYGNIITHDIFVQILDEEGIKNWSQFITPEMRVFREWRTIDLNGRILKPDGNIVYSDESDIHIANTNVERKGNRYGTKKKRWIEETTLKLVMPNLEVGDVVHYAFGYDTNVQTTLKIDVSLNYELSQSYVFSDEKLGEVVYLQRKEPVIETRYYCALDRKINVNTISIPQGLIKYYATDELTSDPNTVVHVWYARMLDGLKTEPFMPPHKNITAQFMWSVQYTMDKADKPGEWNSWENISESYYKIVEDKHYNKSHSRSYGPLKDIVEDLTAGSTGRREKAEILYNYLVSECRIITPDSKIYAEINTKGFGDYDKFKRSDYWEGEKYMNPKQAFSILCAMYNLADIDFDIVMGDSWTNGVLMEELPSSHWFDAVFVRLVFDPDTIFVDVHDGTCRFGQIRPEYFGTVGLVVHNNDSLYSEENFIYDNKPFFCDIPNTSCRNNCRIRKLSYRIDNALGAAGEYARVYKGVPESDNRLYFIETDSLTLEKELRERFEERMPGIRVEEIKWSNPRDFQNNFHVNYSYTKPEIGTEAGNLLLVNPNPLAQMTKHDFTAEKRYQDIWYDYPESYIDSTIIVVPENYKVNSCPEMVVLNKSFGSYINKYVQTDSGLVHTRILMYKNMIIPREQYENISDFHDQIIAADARQVVLEKVN
ncbi:MAG: hypothetical protein GF307_11285 [candidate division Zixibacteria bacterium]|nr:hypothetical protein [candidate division Zixibacteria bacterium]